MTLNFPAAPSSGATHNAANGLQYTFDGVKWTSQGSYAAGLKDIVKLDSIASQFNGSLTSFNLTANSSGVNPVSAESLTISLNGVIQEPQTAYTINTATGVITFASAPATGTTFYGVLQSRLPLSATSVTLGDASVTEAKLSSNAVTNAKVKSTAAIDASKLSYTSTRTGAVARGVDSKLGDLINVKDFGAKGDDSTDDRAAIQAAITAAQVTGGTVYIPEGKYIINGAASSDDSSHAIYKKDGLLIPFKSANGTDNHINIIGAGHSTVLKAGENDMYVIRLSDSHCRVENLTIDGNSKTEIVGIGLVPESRTQASTLTFQLYNVISNLYIKTCEFATVYATGPDIGGSDSGCWYNMFKDSHLYNCTTGILLDTSTNSTSSASGVNRNKFQNIRIGHSNTNTGVEIKDGDTNTFFEIDFEGVNDLTSPNSTPTAIKVAATGASSGADCNHNTFMSCKFENCSRDIDNANSTTEFYACNVSYNKLLLTQTPLIMLGGNDTSQVPQVFKGYVFQGNSQIAGHSNNIASFTHGIKATTAQLSGLVINSYGEFKSYNFGTIAAGASETATISAPRSNKQLFVEIFSVGRENTNSGTFVMRSNGLANWAGSTKQTVGHGETNFDESLGEGDYRGFSGGSHALDYDGNNLRFTITNSGSGTMTTVVTFVRMIWSS